MANSLKFPSWKKQGRAGKSHKMRSLGQHSPLCPGSLCRRDVAGGCKTKPTTSRRPLSSAGHLSKPTAAPRMSGEASHPAGVTQQERIPKAAGSPAGLSRGGCPHRGGAAGSSASWRRAQGCPHSLTRAPALIPAREPCWQQWPRYPEEEGNEMGISQKNPKNKNNSSS